MFWRHISEGIHFWRDLFLMGFIFEGLNYEGIHYRWDLFLKGFFPEGILSWRDSFRKGFIPEGFHFWRDSFRLEFIPEGIHSWSDSFLMGFNPEGIHFDGMFWHSISWLLMCFLPWYVTFRRLIHMSFCSLTCSIQCKRLPWQDRFWWPLPLLLKGELSD